MAIHDHDQPAVLADSEESSTVVDRWCRWRRSASRRNSTTSPRIPFIDHHMPCIHISSIPCPAGADTSEVVVLGGV